MLNKERHQLIMGQILRDIYLDTAISSRMGFKGGTCAFFFYGLPRFSVDLDFDLLELDEASQKLVYETIHTILKKYGKIKDNYIKKNTIFFLLSYGDDDHNVKVEINTRTLISDLKKHYHIKEYLGISVLAGKKDYLFASKLAALTTRNKMAMRDVYDIWFFGTHHFDINAEVIRVRTGKTIEAYMADCISAVETIKDNEMLDGLAELLAGEKEKVWVKAHLRTEVVFLLKNYQSVLK